MTDGGDRTCQPLAAGAGGVDRLLCPGDRPPMVAPLPALENEALLCAEARRRGQVADLRAVVVAIAAGGGDRRGGQGIPGLGAAGQDAPGSRAQVNIP